MITEFELVRFYDWTKLHFQKLSNKAKTNTTSWKKLPAASRVAQWKRAGPVTRRSEDQNLALLVNFFVTLLLRIEFASYFVEAKLINIRKEGVTFYVIQNCLSQNSR